MNLEDIKAVDRQRVARCPIDYEPYNVYTSCIVDGHTIKDTHKLYALNGGEASKYGMLMVEHVGGRPVPGFKMKTVNVNVLEAGQWN